MSKTHNIDINISNSTDCNLTFVRAHFEDGRLANKYSWPKFIEPNSTGTSRCCEKDFSPFGCSGWVEYKADGVSLFFCFSNPSIGRNGIDVGNSEKVFGSMKSHYDQTVTRLIEIKDYEWFSIDISNTAGDVNKANWIVTRIKGDTDRIEKSNIEMRDVKNAFSVLSMNYRRQYYKCVNAPVSISGMLYSHLKGTAFYKNKIIYTHSNLGLILDEKGKYLISENSNHSEIDKVYDTNHQSWAHPCSLQVCGSFMAMGIEASSSKNKTSEVHIYDVRAIQKNMPMKLIAKIQRSGGVNGVAMTRQTIDDGGRYIIAAGEGPVIKIYRSKSDSLINCNPEFDELFEFNVQDYDKENQYNSSGAGLALITQSNGEIFLVTLNANDDGMNSRMNLYLLNLENYKCRFISSKPMPVRDVSESVLLLQRSANIPVIGTIVRLLSNSYLNSSLRWGRGLRIVSSEKFEVYATDRNVLPLSKYIPNSDIDFSLVVWDEHNNC